MSPSLAVVAQNDLNAKIETPVAERVQRLQNEARALAREHVSALTAAIHQAEKLAAEVAGGGEAYPVGIRELAGRFVEEAEARVQTLEVLAARHQ